MNNQEYSVKKILSFIVAITLLLIPTFVFAKGPFTYLTIKGPGISGDISVTNPAMLDFFAFADFSKGGIDAPANLGEGYEVTRSFVNENDEVQNFDRLHYYPDTRYVYYDGLINGSSEYDRQWYVARPDVESSFQTVLAERKFITWLPYTAGIIMLAVLVVAYNKRTKLK
jgi:hypothetical protein